MSIDKDPQKRAIFINDFLKAKGMYNQPKKLTEHELIMKQAMDIWNLVKKRNALPLLKALQDSNYYSPKGTQQLLLSAFQKEFNTWDKDSLVFLISVMHTEELEKQCQELVNQGLHGSDMDKPV